jgi:hypothetical protein
MIIWGGEDEDFFLDTGGAYNPATSQWTPTSMTEAPAGRSDHTAIWTGNRMIVWGGYSYDAGGRQNTGSRYDPGTDTWAATSTAGAPALWSHTSVWTGSRMLVWGDYTGPDPDLITAGGSYTPDTSVDHDGDGYTVCAGDCNDDNVAVHPGAQELCDDIDNICSGIIDLGCDDDDDGYCDAAMVVVGAPVVCPAGGGDCNDHNIDTWPGAMEVNDGEDNQCPGEPGFGVVDELPGPSDMSAAGVLFWPAQSGATLYEYVRSATPDFSDDCIIGTTAATSWMDPESPPAGVKFHYLCRAALPHPGTWGLDSQGIERTVPCGNP